MLHSPLHTKTERFFILDLSLLLKVVLIAHDAPHCLFAAVLLDLIQPSLHVFEGFLVCDVVDHGNSIRPSIVAAGDGPKPILSGRVPLNEKRNTIWSLIVLPWVFMYFIFWIGLDLHSLRQWYCSSCAWISSSWTAAGWSFCLRLRCRSAKPLLFCHCDSDRSTMAFRTKPICSFAYIIIYYAVKQYSIMTDWACFNDCP